MTSQQEQDAGPALPPSGRAPTGSSASASSASGGPAAGHGLLTAEALSSPARLAAARALLPMDTPAVAALDDLTALAAQLLGGAGAHVCVLVDEPVLVATTAPGSDPDPSATCWASVAPAAMTGGEPTTFVGTELHSQDGHVVGTLCVYADHPREWPADARSLLGLLGRAVVAQLAHHAVTESARTSAARLELALEAADIGSFDWNLRTGELVWDDRLIALFGYQRETFGNHVDSLTARVHPEDRERVDRALEESLTRRREYSAEYRVVRPDGSTRWVYTRGRVLADPDGTPGRMLGVGYDSTELRETRDAIARLLETMGDAFFSVDRRWRFTYVNAQAEQLLSRGRKELLGRSLWDEFPEAVGSTFDTEYNRAVATGRATMFEEFYTPLNRWLEVRAVPGSDGLSVYFHDVTDRRTALEDQRRARSAVSSANKRLTVLADASSRLGGSLHAPRILDTLVDLIVPAHARWLAVGLLAGEAALLGVGWTLVEGGPVVDGPGPDDPAAIRIVRIGNSDPGELAAWNSVLPALPVPVGDPFGLGAVARTGTVEYVPRLPEERLASLARTAPVAAAALSAIELGAVLTVPLVSRGRALGAVSVGAHEPFGPLDRTLVEDIARRAAVALDNAGLYGAEQRTALTLQRSLLPRALPQLPGVAVASRYLPSTSGAAVGGDWYDALPLGDGRLGLVIGDVMGHSIRAAGVMGQLRASVATLALEGHSPGGLLARLAGTVDHLLDLELATCLYAVYDPAGRTLRVASAGHPPPLLAPLAGPPEYIDIDPGPPLGVGPTAYQEKIVEVPPVSTLVFYTDGLVETRDASISAGLERLWLAVEDIRLPPDAVCDHVLATMCGEGGSDDDIALLVLSHTVQFDPPEPVQPPDPDTAPRSRHA